MSDRNYSDTEINIAYKIHRDFAEHENNLINHRMTWLITIQSFLIATFGFSFQKYFEIMEKIVSVNSKVADMQQYIISFKVLFIIFSVVGVCTSYATLKSVDAAMRAIENVGENWDDHFRLSSEYSKCLPHVVGKKSSGTRTKGNKLSIFLPLFFIALWFIIFVLTVFLPPLGLIKLTLGV